MISIENVLLIIALLLAFLSFLGLVHYDGFKMGFKYGLERGADIHNSHLRKINQAQQERIIELMQEVRNGKTRD